MTNVYYGNFIIAYAEIVMDAIREKAREIVNSLPRDAGAKLYAKYMYRRVRKIFRLTT